jgi:L-lactate dehydrogenase complex protein LldF
MSRIFRERISKALADPVLHAALDRNATRRKAAREAAFATLPESGAVRSAARGIRQCALEQLDQLVPLFRRRLDENGIQFHQAATASEACAIIVDICRSHNARQVAKSKSMVSEEIGLNAALLEAGIRPIETDLGEFIIQLRGEAPSHITAPAIHLTREQVGATFAERLGVSYTSDIGELTAVARRWLRQTFLEAKVGISGVNFGVAETGTLCLVTNEGNGRMIVSLPPVHIALMGLERLIPRLEDLGPMLAVLPRAGTGQAQTSYVSLVQTPQRPGDGEGAVERHLVLVDNGRRKIRKSALSEALLCIRCGACLNACPVYREIGGHAYGSVYPGPIGSVISPLIFGMSDFCHLAWASTLCGACREACPIDIDLPKLLLEVRSQAIETGLRFRPAWQGATRLFCWLTASSVRFELGQRLGGWLMSLWPRRDGWVQWLPPPLNSWTRLRDFPLPARRPFRLCWTGLAEPILSQDQARQAASPDIAFQGKASDSADDIATFIDRAQQAGALVLTTTRTDIEKAASGVLPLDGTESVLVSDAADPLVGRLVKAMQDQHAAPITQMDRLPAASLASAEASITSVEAGLAETGSLVLLSGRGHSLLASLLPSIHCAVLPASRIRPSLSVWLRAGGARKIIEASQAVLVTGPSRTADIEMSLTVGIHGPRQLVILLVKDA